MVVNDGLSGASSDDDDDCVDCSGADDRLSVTESDAIIASTTYVLEAESAVNAAIETLIESVTVELDSEIQHVHTAIAESSGSVDLELDSAHGTVIGTAHRWGNQVEREYNLIADELYHAGVTLPYTVESMRQDLLGDPLAMLASRIPAVAEVLGSEYEPTPAPSDEPSGTVGITPPVRIKDPFPIGSTGTTGGTSDDESEESETGTVPPPIPGTVTSGGSTPGITTTRTTGTAGECGNITVNVTVPPPTVTVTPGTPFRFDGPRTSRNQSAVPPTVPAVPGTSSSGTSPPTSPPVPPAPPEETPFTSTGGLIESLLETEIETEEPASPVPPPLFSPIDIPSTQRVPMLDWNRPGQCAPLNTFLNSLAPIGAPSVGTQSDHLFKQFTSASQQAFIDSINWLGNYQKTTQSTIDTAAAGKAFADGLFDATVSKEMIDRAADAVLPDAVRHVPAVGLYGSRIGLARQVEDRTGIPMGYLTTGEMYALQYANPMFLPLQQQINGAYLADTISSSTWECWTRAIGNLPEPARSVLVSQSLRPGVGDVLQLYFRGKLNAEQFAQRLRELGVLNVEHVQDYATLYEQLPTMSDLLRFMVRDSADDKVAELYQYDSEFTEKFTGPLKSWAKSQGITPDVFKYFWRAHWEIPSNTALYEMFHRLRPDRAERVEWEALNPQSPGESSEAYRMRGPATVTRSDIEQAMRVNDVAPGWVPRLLDVSYRPITRTDATRAFLIGSFNETQLRSSLLDNGYSPENAELLVNYYRLQRQQRIGNVGSGWTVRKLVKYYQLGRISQAETITRLRKLVDTEEQIRAIIESADQTIEADRRGRVITTLRRGFLVGEMDWVEATDALKENGVDWVTAQRLVDDWTIDRDGRFKQPSTEQVLQWMRKRLIPVGEAMRRLGNLGWKRADGEKMIELAVMQGEAKGDVSAEEVGGVFEQAIRTAREARQETDTRLSKRLADLMREEVRIRKELERRNGNASTNGAPLIQIP